MSLTGFIILSELNRLCNFETFLRQFDQKSTPNMILWRVWDHHSVKVSDKKLIVNDHEWNIWTCRADLEKFNFKIFACRYFRRQWLQLGVTARHHQMRLFVRSNGPSQKWTVFCQSERPMSCKKLKYLNAESGRPWDQKSRRKEARLVSLSISMKIYFRFEFLCDSFQTAKKKQKLRFIIE